VICLFCAASTFLKAALAAKRFIFLRRRGAACRRLPQRTQREENFKGFLHHSHEFLIAVVNYIAI